MVSLEKSRGRRAQAAFEFMSTYGWAILVITVVLAAFIGLGVLNPRTPDTCGVPGMECANAKLVASTGRITMTLTNDFVEKMQVCSAYCSAGPIGSNGLPTVNGQLIVAALAGGAGCTNTPTPIVGGGLGGDIIVDPGSGGGIIVVPGTGSGTITIPGGSTGDTITLPPAGSGTAQGTTTDTTGSGVVADGTGGGVTIGTGTTDTTGAGTTGQTVATQGAKTAMLQIGGGGIINPPNGTISIFGDFNPYLDIGQSSTMTTTRPCIGADGIYAKTAIGEKYNGKLYVEYVLRDDAKGTTARILVGTVTATAQP